MGVTPALSRAQASAPRRTSRLAREVKRRFCDARCSGVVPSRCLASTLALASRSSSSTSTERGPQSSTPNAQPLPRPCFSGGPGPGPQAVCSGVLESRAPPARASVSARAASNARTVPAFPLCTARCSADDDGNLGSAAHAFAPRDNRNCTA
eukprot:1146147-Rhodomonas_salina.1